MSALGAVSAGLLSALVSFAVLSASACGTDAEGIDDCRKIERARCAAGETCGVVSDVDSCRRFYRDQCLHGLSGKSPGVLVVDLCVNTLRAAGECARAGRETELSACPGVTASAPELSRACDVVLRPEKTAECSFLAPSAPATVTPAPDASSPVNDAASDAAPE